MKLIIVLFLALLLPSCGYVLMSKQQYMIQDGNTFQSGRKMQWQQDSFNINWKYFCPNQEHYFLLKRGDTLIIGKTVFIANEYYDVQMKPFQK
jgi:hypothetical protein